MNDVTVLSAIEHLTQVGTRQQLAEWADSHLIDNHTQVEEGWLEGVETVGITSGASAPEELVERLVEFFRERGADDVSELRTVHEDVRFMLPKEIREEIAARG